MKYLLAMCLTVNGLIVLQAYVYHYIPVQST